MQEKRLRKLNFILNSKYEVINTYGSSYDNEFVLKQYELMMEKNSYLIIDGYMISIWFDHDNGQFSIKKHKVRGDIGSEETIAQGASFSDLSIEYAKMLINANN